MQRSNSSSSRRQIRAPFGPVTELFHVTIGLYEIQDLVRQLIEDMEHYQVPPGTMVEGSELDVLISRKTLAEISRLLTDTIAKAANINQLAGGIINVTLPDPQAWQRIAAMQPTEEVA